MLVDFLVDTSGPVPFSSLAALVVVLLLGGASQTTTIFITYRFHAGRVSAFALLSICGIISTYCSCMKTVPNR